MLIYDQKKDLILKNKKTKNAEFIDLKQSEFKKKGSILKLIGGFVLFFTIIFLVLKLNHGFFNNNRTPTVIKKVENLEDEEMIQQRKESSNLINENSIYSSLKRYTDSQILRIDEQSKSNLEKLNQLEILFIEMNSEINKNTLNNNNQSNNDLVNLLANQNLKLFTFLKFKRKILNNLDYSNELFILKNLYKSESDISKYLIFFEALDTSKYKKYDELITLLNDELRSNNVYAIESTSSKQKKDDLNIKEYFFQIVNSTFKIKKIEENQTLIDYEDNNFDGILDYKYNLNVAKEFLTAKNTQKSLEKINELDSPLSSTLKKWIEYAKLRVEIENSINELEDKVFNLFLENYDDKNY